MTKAIANDLPATSNENPYLALGVRPFINCASVRTNHSGSVMLPEVRAAIAHAHLQQGIVLQGRRKPPSV
jgi:hypothetical protein